MFLSPNKPKLTEKLSYKTYELVKKYFNIIKKKYRVYNHIN